MKKCYLLIALFALVLVGPIAASTKAVSFSVVANATQTEMDYLRQIAVLESTNALEKKYYETVTVSYQVFQYTLVYKSTSATGTEVDHTALLHAMQQIQKVLMEKVSRRREDGCLLSIVC